MTNISLAKLQNQVIKLEKENLRLRELLAHQKDVNASLNYVNIYKYPSYTALQCHYLFRIHPTYLLQ